jgi:hypothetical protein
MATMHRTAAAVSAAVLCAALLAAVPASGASRRASPRAAGELTVLGPPTAVPVGAVRIGTLAASSVLSMRIVLQPRDAAALASFVASVSTPSSPNYRAFLAPGAFASRFGPRSSTIADVRATLASEGLAIGALSRDDLVLTVTGTAQTFSRALGAQFDEWRLADGRDGYRLAGPTQIASTIAPDVEAILGVSTLSEPHETAIRRAPAPRVPAPRIPAPRDTAPAVASSGCAGATQVLTGSGLTPGAEARAYGLSTQWAQGFTGAGSTIALVELASYATSDLVSYDHCFGLIGAGASADPQVSNVYVDETGPQRPSNGSSEPTLDVEEVRSLAPAAKVKVYEAPQSNFDSSIDVLTRIADDDTATIVSTSWGQCESEEGSTAAGAEGLILEQMAAQGQSVLAAAGDSGSSDCYYPPHVTDTSLAVDDPASQPDVTGVGGLQVTQVGSSFNQSVWNSGSSAGGGGISSLHGRPAWQAAAGVPSTGPAATARLVPDLSVDGDPSTGIAVYLDGTYQVWGGTSMGSPLIAAIAAVAQQRCSLPTGFGLLNPLLYSIAPSAGAFNDVTTGDNWIFSQRAGSYSAGPGYDLASGLGSPGSRFITALCGQVARAATSTATASAPGATWTMSYTTGPGAYPAGTTITVTAPPGTSLPSAGSAWSVTDGLGSLGASVSLAAGPSSATDNVAVLTPAAGSEPGADTPVRIVAAGVTNPAVAGIASVTFADSFDQAVQSAPIAFAAPVPSAATSSVVASPASVALAGTGATVTVTVRDAQRDLVGGARVTAVATGDGVAQFLGTSTAADGTLSFTVRDDTAQTTRVTVSANKVVVGSAAVVFTDPWSSSVAAGLPAGSAVAGAPGVAALGSPPASDAVALRTTAGRILLGSSSSGVLSVQPLAVTASTPLAASTPALVASGSSLYAVYRATSGDLVELRQSGAPHVSGWTGTDLTAAGGAPAVTGDPTLALLGSGAAAQLSIAAVSSSGDVVACVAAASAAASCTAVDLSRATSTAGAMAGDVAQVPVGTGEGYLARASNGRLALLSSGSGNSGSWRADWLAADAGIASTGSSAVVSSPAAAIGNGGIVVAATTAGGSLEVFQGVPGSWSETTMTAGPGRTSRPFGLSAVPAVAGTPVVATTGAVVELYALTAAGRVIQFTSLGVSEPWASFDLSSLAGLGTSPISGIRVLPAGPIGALCVQSGQLVAIARQPL